MPRDNEAVNECWLSDRDRYAHEGLYADDRASHPMLKENGQWREASWDEALAVASAALTSVSPQAVGLLAHPRLRAMRKASCWPIGQGAGL